MQNDGDSGCNPVIAAGFRQEHISVWLSVLSSLPGVPQIQFQLRCKWRSYRRHQEPVGGKRWWRSKRRVQPGGARRYCPHCLLHGWRTQRIQRRGAPQRTCRAPWLCGQGRRSPCHCQGPLVRRLLPLTNYEQAPDWFAIHYIITYYGCSCQNHSPRDGTFHCIYTVHRKTVYMYWTTKYVTKSFKSSALKTILSALKVQVPSLTSINFNNARISFHNRERSHLKRNTSIRNRTPFHFSTTKLHLMNR